MPPADSEPHEITAYDLSWSTDPDPLVANQEGTFTIEIRDQDGHPIEDLQQNHERIVHTMFVSADWSTFEHTHHEDFAALTVDDLRNATFHFPLTLPLAGSYLIMFGYAHENLWLYENDRIEIEGSPEQAPAPDTTPTSVVELDGIVAELSWSIEPRPGSEAAWTVSVTDGDGNPVDDVIPYLGADAHCALVNEDLSWGSHTHAWFPGMDTMAPSMEMPHLYDGPELPFVYLFPTAGTYKMWVQFTRASAPDTIYAVPFVFVVGS